MAELSIGSPIPLGIIDAQGVHETTPSDEPDALEEQLASLRQQVEDLRGQLAKIGEKTLASVQAHPFMAAAAMSIGLWTLLALTARGVNRHVHR